MNKNTTIIILLFFMTLFQLSIDIYLPSTLVMAQELHTSDANIQMTFFTFLLAGGLSQLLYGPLMDRFGRKPFLIMGSLVFLITALIAACSTSIVTLIIARTFQGLGMGVFSVGSRATMRDILTHDEFKKTAIYQGLTWSFVPVFAPVIGSYVQHYLGWRYNFGILACAGLLCLIFSLLLKESLKQPQRSLHPAQIIKTYRNILINSNFWPFMLGAATDSILLACFYLFAPILLQGNLGIPVISYGWIMFWIAMSALIAMVINRLIVNRIPDRLFMLASICLSVCSGLVILLGCLIGKAPVTFFMVAMILMQVGMSWLFPLCISHAMRPMQSQAGSAAAMIGMNNLTSGSISALLIAYFVINSEWRFGVLYIIVSVILLVVFLKKVYSTHSQAL